jgi:L-threonylcarbamoyladenylate synthase
MLSWQSRIACHVLRNGGVIAYPTEAVWGLGCLPQCKEAVQRILDLKNRSVDKGLILVAASTAQLSPYLEGLTKAELRRLDESWPGPVTWLVPDNGAAPSWVKGSHQTVALRVSDHPIIQSICNTVGSAIVSTSANITGRQPIREPLKLRQQFGPHLDYIYAGELGGARTVTAIRHLREDRLVRGG